MALAGEIVGKVQANIKQFGRTTISKLSNWFGPLEPLKPFAPRDAVVGRQRDYQVGENMVIRTRETGRAPFSLLRSFAENCDILRLVIETRKDQVEALAWKIVKVDGDEKTDAKNDQTIKDITKFLKRPDKRLDWGTWLKALLEDMFVLDAATFYKRRDRAGRLYSLDLMDGSLIKVLNDGDGRVPLFPDPSYQQLLHGMTAIDYTTQEIAYLPRTIRTWSVYGLSVVEQILITIETLLNRTRFNANYYVDGNLPAGLIFMDTDLTSEQIEAYTAFLDTSLTGNLKDRRKLLPTPGSKGKYQEIREPPMKDEYDEWLARIICFAFSISPQPFVKEMNRATANTAQDTALAEGLAPITKWIEGWVNALIEEEFGTDQYIFTFDSPEEMDQTAAAAIRKSDVEAGIISRDEAREDMGLEPLGGAAGELGVTTGSGFMPLEMGLEQAQATHDAKIEAIKNPKPPLEGAPGSPGEDKPTKDKMEKIRGSKKNSTDLDRPVAVKARRVIAQKVKQVFERTAFSVAHQIRNPAFAKADSSLAEKIVLDLDLSSLGELDGVEGDIQSVAVDSGNAMITDVGVGRTELFNQINTRALAFARERAAELVAEIEETTRDRLRDLISQGLADKKTIDEIADSIQSLDGDIFDADRALLIADTEVGIANGEGAIDGLEEAQKLGINVKKVWVVTDADTCDICLDNADEGPIDIDEEFSSGDDATPAHPRCRCTIAGVVDENPET